jgi:hypothetical protein
MLAETATGTPASSHSTITSTMCRPGIWKANPSHPQNRVVDPRTDAPDSSGTIETRGQEWTPAGRMDVTLPVGPVTLTLAVRDSTASSAGADMAVCPRFVSVQDSVIGSPRVTRSEEGSTERSSISSQATSAGSGMREIVAALPKMLIAPGRTAGSGR